MGNQHQVHSSYRVHDAQIFIGTISLDREDDNTLPWDLVITLVCHSSLLDESSKDHHGVEISVISKAHQSLAKEPLSVRLSANFRTMLPTSLLLRELLRVPLLRPPIPFLPHAQATP